MIAILDYGSGNLRSAARACETTGNEVVVTSDPKVALEAQGLVVPGVGAFAACMAGLLAVGGDEIIRKRKLLERPTLGICVGMQILFSEGTETNGQGNHVTRGVGLWDGEVSKIKAEILPHMGWNTVRPEALSPLFSGIENESFYFVHSFAAKKAVGIRTAWTEYGETFVAAIEDGALTATQFHPEKSGAAGLVLMKNWAQTL
ncbi:unannotated protein [freshwater metagenome]|uniref:Unannotated protein n=1 Tax=freshwater metagenome TaxID=449393 RepID=A0A6J6W6N8_9ZZZZ